MVPRVRAALLVALAACRPAAEPAAPVEVDIVAPPASARPAGSAKAEGPPASGEVAVVVTDEAGAPQLRHSIPMDEIRSCHAEALRRAPAQVGWVVFRAAGSSPSLTITREEHSGLPDRLLDCVASALGHSEDWYGPLVQLVYVSLR